MADEKRSDPSRGIPDPAAKEKSVNSQKLSAERAIMEMTGANRSQIRHAALGTPLREFMARFQAAAAAAPAPAPALPPPAAKLEIQDQSFAPKPLTLGVRAGEGGSGGSQPVPQKAERMYVLIGAVFYERYVVTTDAA